MQFSFTSPLAAHEPFFRAVTLCKDRGIEKRHLCWLPDQHTQKLSQRNSGLKYVSIHLIFRYTGSCVYVASYSLLQVTEGRTISKTLLLVCPAWKTSTLQVGCLGGAFQKIQITSVFQYQVTESQNYVLANGRS